MKVLSLTILFLFFGLSSAMAGRESGGADTCKKIHSTYSCVVLTDTGDGPWTQTYEFNPSNMSEPQGDSVFNLNFCPFRDEESGKTLIEVWLNVNPSNRPEIHAGSEISVNLGAKEFNLMVTYFNTSDTESKYYRATCTKK
jgi:hypothetical protein